MSTTVKLLPGAPNNANYPVNGSFNQLIAWEEGAAQAAVLNQNQNAATDYLNTTWNSWFTSYEAGRLPWDSIPPSPPVSMMAMVTESIGDNGSQNVTYVPVPDPQGGLVCQVPSYTKIPPPQAPGSGVIAQPVIGGGNPTIVVVPLYQQSTDSWGNGWLRVK